MKHMYEYQLFLWCSWSILIRILVHNLAVAAMSTTVLLLHVPI
jgi:hypothetical protein